MSCLVFPSRAERLALRALQRAQVAAGGSAISNALPVGETPPGCERDAWREPAAGPLALSRSTAPLLESIPELLPPAGDRAGSPCSGPPTEETGGREETAAAIAAIVAERARHLANGHTPASDAAEGPKRLATLVAREGEQVRAFAFKPAIDTDHAALRRHAIKTAAFAVALVESLAVQPESRHAAA